MEKSSIDRSMLILRSVAAKNQKTQDCIQSGFAVSQTFRGNDANQIVYDLIYTSYLIANMLAHNDNSDPKKMVDLLTAKGTDDEDREDINRSIKLKNLIMHINNKDRTGLMNQTNLIPINDIKSFINFFYDAKSATYFIATKVFYLISSQIVEGENWSNKLDLIEKNIKDMYDDIK